MEENEEGNRHFRDLTLGIIFGTSFVLQDSGFFSRPSSAQGKPLKIGVLEPLSGVYAEAGQRAVKGMQMAFEQHGSEVAGRPIKLIVEDTELNPQVALYGKPGNWWKVTR